MIRSAYIKSVKGQSAQESASRFALVNIGAEYENLDQKAYQLLKSMIMERQLLPGEKIPQEKLAEEMGISRTPLVNALKLLEQDKLVQSIPRSGFFVRVFSNQEMISIFELREVLEGLVARKAAQNITDQEIQKLKKFFKQFKNVTDITDTAAYAREDRNFHAFLAEIGAKEFLRSILDSFNIISFSYQRISTDGLIRSPNETIRDHLAIIEAVSNRDPDAAERFMRYHLNTSLGLLRKISEDEAN
jgi:DNA-binding GntR family transcriptional regulator